MTDDTAGWMMLAGFVAAKAFVDWRLLALAAGNLESWHAGDAGSSFRYAVWCGERGGNSARPRSVEGPPDLISPTNPVDLNRLAHHLPARIGACWIALLVLVALAGPAIRPDAPECK